MGEGAGVSPGMGSLSARRAWIEIWKQYLWYGGHCVALRKESVDRNGGYNDNNYTGNTVALRKESVDRNATTLLVYLALIVALRKESVDRNSKIAKKVLTSM